MGYSGGLLIDNFAGGGGASTGIEAALARAVDVAINHDGEAMAMHEANHPNTRHIRNNIWQIDPLDVTKGRPVELAWFSPDCKHHSKAKGGKPRDKSIRDLAWVVVLWAKRVRPDAIFLENVEEFRSWGPLDDDGQPIKAQAGETWEKWLKALRKEGYRIQWRELRACDYGAPTIRKRLLLIARRDGKAIVWPKPTHGPGRPLPWRTAAECIDWSLPCPSIFLTKEEGRAIGVKRPLAPATMARIAKGVKRYVIDAAEPFIVNLTHHGGDRNEAVSQPFKTVTAANRGEKALVVPHITKFRAGSVGHGLDEPLHTVTANSFIKRPGGAPPFGLVSAFLAQHNTMPKGGVHAGHDVRQPVSTMTAKGCQQTLVAAHLINLKGSSRRMAPADEPSPAITAGGFHIGEVRAFLLKYYGTDQDPQLGEPMHTVTTKDRFGLVMVQGEPYEIVDIGMRMLTPRELFAAQGFPPDYIIDPPGPNGKPLTKTAQIRMCGNSVCPPIAEAIVRANFAVAVEEPEKEAA